MKEIVQWPPGFAVTCQPHVRPENPKCVLTTFGQRRCPLMFEEDDFTALVANSGASARMSFPVRIGDNGSTYPT